jgi:tetratricopeptide (TPR) repeat protein
MIHPESVINDFKDLRMYSYELTHEHILPFIPRAGQVDQEKNKGLTPAAKIISENVSVHNAATRLLRTSEWDFMAVYYDLIDHFCHAYMKFYPPKLKGINKEQYDIYKEAVIGAYRFQDMMLGRTLELIDDNTTVMVMSDHGYESGNKRLLKLPKVQAAAAMDHRQFGMFVAKGPNIKKNEKIYGLGLIDIAPTILYHYDLPVGRDMDGKVALEIFEKQDKIKFIDSWEALDGDFGEIDRIQQIDSFSDQETIDQLVELGYIEKPNESVEIAVRKTKCDLKHNLARVYLGKKDYVSAKRILDELIKEKEPIDVSQYYMDLVTLSIEQKDYDSADSYLSTLKKLKTEVKYSLFFPESSILLGKGKPLKALAILEKARSENRENNSELWFKIGMINFRLGKFKEANEAYEKAIEIEPDKAKFHAALAENLIELKEYEEAVDSALTSIELVKFYSKAHYVLGRALEKLGDFENAKVALETASRLTPKTFHEAEHAIENLNEKLEFKDKASNRFKNNQIVIVSGLPRSGTSLMMQMLDKGGIKALTDNKRKPDNSNPKGYYEYEPVMAIKRDNSWLANAQNNSLKVVAPLLGYLDPKYRYKVIFMNRDLNEILKSQQVMIGRNPDTLPFSLFNSFKKQLKQVEIWKNKEPGVELLYVNYKDVLENPDAMAAKIEAFIGKKLNQEDMVKCIDKNLYRNRLT